MDKYTITLSDGTRWTYAPRGPEDIAPWSADGGWRYMFPRGYTPADFRACADVVERWEADHKPKMRRRVVKVGDHYYARHEMNGWVWAFDETNARKCAKAQTVYDMVLATDEVIDALLSLRDQPEEEYTDDE